MYLVIYALRDAQIMCTQTIVGTILKTKKKWCCGRLGCHYLVWKEVASCHLISKRSIVGSCYLLGIFCTILP